VYVVWQTDYNTHPKFKHEHEDNILKKNSWGLQKTEAIDVYPVYATHESVWFMSTTCRLHDQYEVLRYFSMPQQRSDHQHNGCSLNLVSNYERLMLVHSAGNHPLLSLMLNLLHITPLRLISNIPWFKVGQHVTVVSAESTCDV